MSKLEVNLRTSVHNPDFARRNVIAIEIEKRSSWERPALQYTRDVLAPYAANAASDRLDVATDADSNL